MLRFVNSENRTMDVAGPTCNFNLTRLNTVDYSLPIAAQQTIKDDVGKHKVRSSK